MTDRVALMLISALVAAASFPGRAVAADPRPATGHVRVLYAVPADREFRTDYRRAVQDAAADFRQWLRRELDGWTFQLYRATPEDCRLGEPSEFYERDSWNKVFSGVQHCAPVSYDSPGTVWVIYADVVHECDAPGRLGAAAKGLTILPRQDLEGLIGNAIIDDCGTRWDQPVTRWIGGLGHELGHALGLPHPPGCDEGAPSCDHDALMWAGYASYPNTYLRDDEKEYLLESPFIGFEGVVPALPTTAAILLAAMLLIRGVRLMLREARSFVGSGVFQHQAHVPGVEDVGTSAIAQRIDLAVQALGRRSARVLTSPSQDHYSPPA